MYLSNLKDIKIVFMSLTFAECMSVRHILQIIILSLNLNNSKVSFFQNRTKKNTKAGSTWT